MTVAVKMYQSGDRKGMIYRRLLCDRDGSSARHVLVDEWWQRELEVCDGCRLELSKLTGFSYSHGIEQTERRKKIMASA